MKERPILFSAPMVHAILDGRKTQTRRVVKGPIWVGGLDSAGRPPHARHIYGKVATVKPCPYGNPGDRLRVKEAAWMWCERRPNGKTKTGRDKWLYVPMREAPIHYAADHPEKPQVDVVSPDTGNIWGWRLKIGRFLPAWASRITLEIVSVRVERLQDISEEDALAEGIKGITKDGRTIKYGIPDKDGLPGNDDNGWHWCNWMLSASAAFQELWQEINGYDSWEDNPWVWVVDFKRVQP